MPEHVLEARYERWASLHRDCDQQIARGGMFLRTSVDLAQFSPVTLRIVVPNGELVELSSQVLQVMAGQGIALQLDAAADPEVERLKGICKAHPSEGSAEPLDPQVGPPTPEAEEPKPQPRVGARRLQLATEPQELRRQLESMTVNQKRGAALSASRAGRIMLIKDRQKAVHPFVLKNPGITLDEVELIAKMPSVNPEALRMIAKNRDWTRSTTVCRNLVRNPKTPMPDALRLLEKLPLNDIRAMAKGGNVRTPIQQAARKKINQ